MKFPKTEWREPFDFPTWISSTLDSTKSLIVEYLILYVLTRVKHATHRDLLSLPSIEMKDSSGILSCILDVTLQKWRILYDLMKYKSQVYF